MPYPWRTLRGLLLASVLAVSLPASYLVRSWGQDNGPVVRGVSALAQTRDGFFWLGTLGGLMRFDGEHFDRIELNPAMRSRGNRVTALWPDTNGDLWLGFETGEVAVRRGGTGQVDLRPRQWPPFSVRAIANDARGEMWALLSDHSLVRLGDGWRSVASPSATQSGLVHFVTEVDGALWAMHDSRAERIEGGAADPALQLRLPGEGSAPMREVTRAKAGGLWVASDVRIRRWAGGVWHEERGPHPCPDAEVTALHETQAGDLVFGTRDQGLIVLAADGTVQRYTRTEGLAHDWILALDEDREGNLLVGTAGGLSILSQQRVEAWPAPDQWRHERLLAVAPAAQGGWWVGTEGAGLYQVKADGTRRFGRAEGLTKEFVWSVLEESDGQMWVGTWGEGLFTRKEGHFEQAPGWNSRAWVVTALQRTQDHTLWAGTNLGLASLQDGVWRWITEVAGVTLGSVRCLAEDAQGRLYFGTSGHGLGRVVAGRVELLKTDSEMKEAVIQTLHFDAQATLWVGTQGRGVWRLKGERWAHVDAAQGLPSDEIGHIAEDGKGYHWFASPAGVFAVPSDQLNACLDGRMDRVPTILLDHSDGMPASECAGGAQNTALMLADGRFLVPTARGLALIRTWQIARRTHPPTIAFTQVTADDHTVVIRGHEPVEAGPGVRRLEVFFSAPDFTAPAKMRFRYQLHGLDDQWIELGARRSVLFNYLRPGRYELSLRAVNGDGVVIPQPATLAITLRAHYWETVWFRFLLGCLGLLSATLVIWLIVRWRAQKRLRLVEQQHAIERERTRIARDIHDDLGASLCRIMLLSQREPAEAEAAGSGRIRQINHLARTITRTMDELVWTVDPRHDTLESFAAYAARLTQELLVDAQLRCRIQIAPDLPKVRLSAGVRHHLLMALRESLRNAIRHARSTEVLVALTVENQALHLVVVDNGTGFAMPPAGSPAASPGGNGLSNLRVRLGEIGGRAEISSAPGAGTTIRLVAPLEDCS